MTMWMVRAGRDSRLFQSFIEKGVVAIGWGDVGDLNNFQSREDILTKVREQWPEWKPQHHVTSNAMLYRFLREMKPGHGVITYDQTRRIYAVGKIDGDYRFDPAFHYENVRPVKWDATEISRDALSPATRNTLGSALALFRLSDDAEGDVLRVVEGSSAPQDTEEIANEEEDFLEDIEARGIEFIKDRIVRLSWDDMQELVAGLLRAMGYKTRMSVAGADRGKDIVASPDGFGFEDPRIVVEVKHRLGSMMGSSEIRSFLGGRHPNDKGLYVSTGGFSKEARYEAERANIPVTLMGLDELVESIIDNYERMEPETRSLVPLKRVYWPVGTIHKNL